MTEGFTDPTEQDSGASQSEGAIVNGAGDQSAEMSQGVELQPQEYNWREMIAEDLATSPSMEKFNGKPVDEVVRSYLNLERKLGGNPIVKPGEDATEDQWNEYWGQLGRPASPDEYNLPTNEDVPHGYNPSPDYEKSFRQAAFEAGGSETVVAKTWEALQNTAIKDYKTAVEANGERVTEAFEGLKKEWGSTYQEKIQLANRAATRAGGQPLLEWMKKTGADKEVMLIKAFAEFGAGMKEDTIGQTDSAPLLTPKEAMSKINKIKADPAHPYNNKKSPMFDEAVKEVAELFEFVYPDDESGRTTNREEYSFGVGS